MPLFNFFRRKKELSLLIVVFIVLLIFSSTVTSFPKLSFVSIIKIPVYVMSFAIKEIKSLVFYRINLGENVRLKKENAQLKQQLINLDELLRENEKLEKFLKFKKKSKFSFISARVISRDITNWTNSLLIDRGSSSGIKEGQLVVVEGGLVGRIIETGGNTSRVLLITDPDSNIAGFVQRSRETGVVSGSLLGKCVMRYLSIDSDIEENDLVLTLGVGDSSPKGIVIGDVISWHIEHNGVSYSAIIRPRVNLSAIEEVLVVK